MSHPALPVVGVFPLLEKFGHLKGVAGVDHDGVFVGVAPPGTFFKSLGVGAVVDAVGVEGQGAGGNVVSAEKVAFVVEENFVVVDIGVVEGDFENPMFFVFQGTLHKRAYHKIFGGEGGVSRRGNVVAVAHDGAVVVDGDFPRVQGTLPALDIQGIVGIGDLGQFPLVS